MDTPLTNQLPRGTFEHLASNFKFLFIIEKNDDRNFFRALGIVADTPQQSEEYERKARRLAQRPNKKN